MENNCNLRVTTCLNDQSFMTRKDLASSFFRKKEILHLDVENSNNAFQNGTADKRKPQLEYYFSETVKLFNELHFEETTKDSSVKNERVQHVDQNELVGLLNFHPHLQPQLQTYCHFCSIFMLFKTCYQAMAPNLR